MTIDPLRMKYVLGVVRGEPARRDWSDVCGRG